MAFFTERLHAGFLARYPVRRRLLRQRTPFQRLEVYATRGFGRMLVLDDIVEATERDEFIYHEMMVHVAMYTHPDPRRVLIVGDGAAYVRQTDQTFDLVIVDSTDPLGPSLPLFGEAFYRDAVRALRPQGLLVRQTGSAMLQPEEVRSAVRHARKVFPCVRVFLSAVPTYVGGFFTHALMGGSDFSRRLLLPRLRRRFAQDPLEMRYCNPEVHAAAFALPEYVRRLTTGAA